MTFACGRRWFGPRTGLVAGLIVATSFGYFPIARSALPDLPLAFFISLATWTLCEALLGRPVWPANHGTELSPQEFPEGDRDSGRARLMEIGGGGNGHGHAVPADRHAAAERRVTSPASAADAGAPRPSRPIGLRRQSRPTSASRPRPANAAGGSSHRPCRWALGLLTKGPVAVALPVMIAFPLVLMARKSWKPTSAGWLGSELASPDAGRGRVPRRRTSPGSPRWSRRTAPPISTASSSAKTSSASRRTSTTIGGRSGSTCRSCWPGSRRGRRSCFSASRRSGAC